MQLYQSDKPAELIEHLPCSRCGLEAEWVNNTVCDWDEFEDVDEEVYVDVYRCPHCGHVWDDMVHPMWQTEDGAYYQWIDLDAPAPMQLGLPMIDCDHDWEIVNSEDGVYRISTCLHCGWYRFQDFVNNVDRIDDPKTVHAADKSEDEYLRENNPNYK